MTVTELIEMLGRCPADYPVKIAYDSMVVISDVEESESFLLNGDDEYRPRGVYLTVGCSCYREDEDGVPIPGVAAQR